MSKRRVCPNCGAYLTEDDKVCYVCGEVVPIQPAQPTEEEAPQDTQQEFFEEQAPLNEQAEEDFSDSAPEDGFGQAYEQEYYEEDEDMPRNPGKKKKKMSRAKKTAIISAVCVGVVAVAAAIICVCFFNGVFTQDEQDEYVLYFNKPNSEINLMQEDGTVYNWGSDVDVVYTLDGEMQQDACKISSEYENAWTCTVPADAEDVYFSQSDGSGLRTEKFALVESDYIYYVTDILVDEDYQLPIDCCPIDEFDSMGINFTQETTQQTDAETEAQVTDAVTEAATETEAETEATTTANDSDAYTVSVPSAWSGATTVVEKNNCTTYYESYNYKNYNCGMLVSIYVFDASDSSYSDMNVKKVITSSDGTKKIVAVTPTDVQFDENDETAMNNYLELEKSTDQLISSITAN